MDDKLLPSSVDFQTPLCLKESCKLERMCVCVLRCIKEKTCDVAADSWSCLGYHSSNLKHHANTNRFGPQSVVYMSPSPQVLMQIIDL